MPTIDLDLANFAPQWHARTLRGQLRTHVARGGPKQALARIVKTTATYLRKELVSQRTLRRILGDVELETVEAFRGWADYEQRKVRFQNLMAGISDLLRL